jgi:hypothetical protein
MKGYKTIVTGLMVVGATAFAGRPLAVDDADPADARQGEIEAGVAYVKSPDCEHWDFPLGMAFGLGHGAELGIGFGGQFEERLDILAESGDEDCSRESGVGDLNVSAKWQFIGESAWCPRQALAPTVKFPTADENKGLGNGETDYDLTWIASKSLGERIGAHVNAGYSWIGEPEGESVGNVLHYGVAVDAMVASSVQWVVEVYAEKELRSGADSTVLCNTGIRWNPVETLTVDVAGGSGLSDDGPDYFVTAGATWAFGFGSNN